MTSPSIVLLRTQSDARLVALAQDGHERAFEAIVERYRRQLLRACRRVLPESRAEDALQQALLAAWTAMERGDDIRGLRPWLHRIAHNTALNQLRAAGYDFDELHEALQIADAPDDELERRAVIRQTLAGLAALPGRQRDALLAIAVEGRSQDEVASTLGLSQGAVRQLVHRARSAMRTAATAITPLPLVSWVAAAATRSEPMATRIAELSAGAGGAGAATVLAKAGVVAVIAGGAVTGPALVERSAVHRGNDGRAHQASRPQKAPAARPRRAVLVDAPAAGRQGPAPPARSRRASGSPQAPSRDPSRSRRSGSSRGDEGGDGERSGSDSGPSITEERSGRRRDSSGDGISGSGSGSRLGSGGGDDSLVQVESQSGGSGGSGPSGGDDMARTDSSGTGGGDTFDGGDGGLSSGSGSGDSRDGGSSGSGSIEH